MLPHRYHGNVRAGAAALLGNRVLWKTLGLPERNEAAIAQAERVLKAALKVGPAAAAAQPALQCRVVQCWHDLDSCPAPGKLTCSSDRDSQSSMVQLLLPRSQHIRVLKVQEMEWLAWIEREPAASDGRAAATELLRAACPSACSFPCVSSLLQGADVHSKCPDMALELRWPETL